MEKKSATGRRYKAAASQPVTQPQPGPSQLQQLALQTAPLIFINHFLPRPPSPLNRVQFLSFYHSILSPPPLGSIKIYLKVL
jgi:hypothetical protein